MISTTKCGLRIPNTVDSTAVRVAAPWKWWTNTPESNELWDWPSSMRAAMTSGG
jgi:hypothetical protein